MGYGCNRYFNSPTGSLAGQEQLSWESVFHSSGAVVEEKY